MKPTLQEENNQAFHLNQAMIGAISPNFRWVSIEPQDDGSFHIYFLLSRDNPRDREEIEKIISKYEVMNEHAVDFEYEVRVDSSPLHKIVPPGRGVYGRKVVDGESRRGT